MSSSCLILMATYNGEKYIAEQIESIQLQSFTDWKMIVRDDGSDDLTLDILNRYCETDKRIQVLQNNTHEHGAFLNFFTLIEFAKNSEPYDYYFFADQDDIWMHNKLEKMMQCANNSEYSNEPMLLYSDMQLIDEKGDLISSSMNEIMGISEVGGYTNFFAHGYFWGCDVMVNRHFFSAVPCPSLNYPLINTIGHDTYFGKFALSHGHVVYMDEPYIQYRRHGENHSSKYDLKLSLWQSLRKFFGGYQQLAKTHARVYSQTLLFVQVVDENGLGNDITRQVKRVIDSGGLSAVRQLYSWRVKRKQFPRTVGMYLILLTKAYKKYMVVEPQV